MNLGKLGIVIRREYLNKVKKKSFLLITFGVPVLFAAMYVILILIMLKAKDEAKRVAVADASGIVMPILEDTETLTFTDVSALPSDSVKNNLEAFGADRTKSRPPGRWIVTFVKTGEPIWYSGRPGVTG